MQLGRIIIDLFQELVPTMLLYEMIDCFCEKMSLG